MHPLKCHDLPLSILHANSSQYVGVCKNGPRHWLKIINYCLRMLEIKCRVWLSIELLYSTLTFGGVAYSDALWDKA